MNQSQPPVLPCRIEAPDALVPVARYAIEMLLHPMALQPVWVEHDVEGCLYYGTDPQRAASPRGFRLHEETVDYFSRRSPYDAQRSFGPRNAPRLFGTPETPDLFASAFFWLSGWDEFVSTERDEHARFCYRHSLQKRLGIQAEPIVDRYRRDLSSRLAAVGVPVGQRTWGGRSWALLPTFDIDYLRRWRPGTLLRDAPGRMLSVLREMLSGRDVYWEGAEGLAEAVDRAGGSATFFFKATSKSAYDPAYMRRRRRVARLMGGIAGRGSEIGLHPGYFAATHPGYMRDEHQRIEHLSDLAITSVRQHYLRYVLPETSRLHESVGLTIDSTLGFPDREGFRRGTCLPFKIFDVVENQQLDVWELPLAFMDGAMRVRRGLDANEALDALKELMAQAKEAGGACVALWHNTLWDHGWEGWPENLAGALQFARQEAAYVSSLRTALEKYLASRQPA